MSDEEELSNAIEGDDGFDAGGGVPSAGSKSKSGLVKILTWVVGIICGTIFIVTVVVITIKVIDRGNQSQSFAQVSEEYNAKPPIMVFYGSNMPQIRGRTADKVPQSFIIELDLGYPESIKEALSTEITLRLPAIVDLIRSYFNSKKAEELSYENEEFLKLQLKEKINRILTNGPIETVVFTKKDIFAY
ncbi:flagellar basal body protein FliL [Thiospirochaeta perfilievii]|uniref:Flagellar protein FliL n=1 Tax=Thiospirochaeta perfilievii TaxID=252967 RepID=A0A5C1QD28_9SPIO|nr:flagellar basal body-associated FliL family protein [Thiospirochaeta perfilievii]QEN06023.1 flagellar basal body protein FliL [Thiospirochaeta perfilievii]